jgi:hypothetical protein
MTTEPHRFAVVEPDAPQPIYGSAVTLGGDLSFDRTALQSFCSSELEKIDVDLLVVLAAVAHVDRRVPRKPSVRWARSLALNIPVHEAEIDRWARNASALNALLGDLTGDFWSIEFRVRHSKDELLQPFIPGLQQEYRGAVVMPYSGGLDSLAGLCAHVADRPTVPALLVHVGHGNPSIDEMPMLANQRYQTIKVPFAVHAPSHPEFSYRTRTFVFFGLAALARSHANGQEICIPEAGQGCLGPSLVPFGIEHPVRGSHPAFVDAFARWLEAIHGHRPRFIFPNVWRTKGEVLRGLYERNALHGWHTTRSCSRDPRRQHPGTSASQCGVCAGCLFRRQSLLAAGLLDQEDSSTYLFDVVQSAEMTGAKPSDREVGVYAVRDLEELAELAERPDALISHAREIGQALRISDDTAFDNLRSLVERHRKEWRSFVARLPRRSWVRELVTENES